jgi:tRNA pseudouridine55 synthase
MAKLASGSPNRSASPRSGVLLYDKPAGVTSHDVVAEVRRAMPKKTKVGHAGTLDPFATGLLLILVGKATRAQQFLMALPKTYRAVARLGWTSTTGDPEGELSETGRIPDDPQIPTGKYLQSPHAYSAVKISGRRAYELAREGKPVEPEARPITVWKADRLSLDRERAAFEITCSSGTYVRQLVAALDDAYCEQLERTAIGDFQLADANPERVIALNEALSFLPERTLDADETEAVSHGRALRWEREPKPGWEAWPAVRLVHADELIAIGRPRDDEIQPDVVFVP